MVILIDLRPLIGGNTSGVEIYTRHLVHHLLAYDQSNTYVLFSNSSRVEKDFFQEFLAAPNVITLQTRIPNKIFNIALSILQWPKLDRFVGKKINRTIDVTFHPDLRPAPVSKQARKITVIHDLAYKHFPQFFSWRSRLWYHLIHPRREILTSHHIIAVSHHTRADLMATYKVSPQKISVIYEGVPTILKEISNARNLQLQNGQAWTDEKYFLFLSTIEPRKNLPTLIQAFHLFKKQNPEHKNFKLVIAGATNRRIFSVSKTISSSSPDVIFTGFVGEKQKTELYKNAEAFVYPSIFEGFGLPLLEAMSEGTPIITSGVSSMPEIVQDAALLVNPNKPNELAAAMKKILTPEVLYKLKTKMKRRLQNFSWQKCAQQTHEVIVDASYSLGQK